MTFPPKLRIVEKTYHGLPPDFDFDKAVAEERAALGLRGPEACPLKQGMMVRLNDEGARLVDLVATLDEKRAVTQPMMVKEVGDEMCPGVWDITLCGPLEPFMVNSMQVERA